MEENRIRTEILIGSDKMKKLKQAKVCVFGLGGVGGYVVEGLARAGVCHFTLVDHDTVSVSNINRQILATTKTVGKLKVDVMKERLQEIDPTIEVETMPLFVLPETIRQFHFEDYDYVVDAIDTITAKIALIQACEQTHTPIISSMGTGNKFDPFQFRIADIYKTTVCPLARVMRRELKKRHVKKLKVLYSLEVPQRPLVELNENDGRRKDTPGSVSFIPSVAGLMIAGEVFKDLLEEK